MGTKHTVLFSTEVIGETVRDLARSIDRDYPNDGVVVLTVMKGAVIFAADLVRAMDTETELAFVRASSYSHGFTPGQSLSLTDEIDLNVAGRDVLIVDDIIDTGRTLSELAAFVERRESRSVATVALVNKTSRRSPGAEPDYYGLEIDDELIYGYGLDWDEHYRDLPYIALANP